MRLSGRVAIVTGGGSGIGKATVRRFAVEGAAVVIADLNPISGEALARDLQGDGHEAAYLRVDVTDEESVSRAVDETVSRFGRLDVMINNAGIGQLFIKDEMTWWQVAKVNLTGVFLGCKHAARVMLPRQSGVILSTASHAGTPPNRGDFYGATKAGVISLTKCVANALVSSSIRVNAVSPGNPETAFGDPRRAEMMRRHWAGDPSAFADDPVVRGEIRPDVETVRQRLDAMHPTGRRAMPDDIAQSFAFLASDESLYVSGNNLLATGHISPPAHVKRILASRESAVTAAPLDISAKAVVLATEHPTLREALGAEFERRGARVVTLAPERFADLAAVQADLAAIAAKSPIGAVVFALRPDQGGELLTTTAEQFDDEIRANLRAPTAIVESAIPNLAPGSSILLVSDSAGQWGGPGSPAYTTAAGALTYHNEYWAAMARERGVRVNCLFGEDLTHAQMEPALGAPVSASELAALAGFVVCEAPGLSGLRLDLGGTHPYPPRN